MPSYTVNEPHPTVAKNSYTHSGRGGAGNFFRAPATTPAAGISTTAMPLPPSTGRFYSGRGGAGNARPAAQRPVMSFDELYKIQTQVENKPVGHVGRGGAGNTYDKSAIKADRRVSDASSHHSASSASSAKSGFLARLSQTLSRH